MAYISLQQVELEVRSRFATQGVSGPSWNNAFLSAANSAISRINRDADLSSSTRVARVTSIDDQVALDDEYRDVLEMGITHYLILFGRRQAQGYEVAAANVRDEFAAGIQSIRRTLANRSMDEDYGEEDFYEGIGLGNIED